MTSGGGHHVVDSRWIDHETEADTHIERLPHAIVVHSLVNHKIEDIRSIPCGCVDHGPDALRERSSEIFSQTAPCDVGGTMYPASTHRGEHIW